MGRISWRGKIHVKVVRDTLKTTAYQKKYDFCNRRLTNCIDYTCMDGVCAIFYQTGVDID